VFGFACGAAAWMSPGWMHTREGDLTCTSVAPSPNPRRGLSADLLAFLDESPLERDSVLAAVRRFAELLPPGASVVDLGAGDAPYRELFPHVSYTTVDWGHSPHEAAFAVDVVASVDALPFEAATFDAAMLTQVLEHVPAPELAVREAHRVVRAGGALLVTVPFIWEEHERPFDFYRFSSAGVRHLLESAGFIDVTVRPRTDCFSTLAQLMRNVGWAMGQAPDGLDARRKEAAELLSRLSEAVLALAPLDAQQIFPLGWEAVGRRAG
jgi:SAM-dependent methyltransferase